MSTLRADQGAPGMHVIRKRATGKTDTLTITAVRRMHKGGVTRYGFDTQPGGNFLGWFTPGAAIHVED